MKAVYREVYDAVKDMNKISVSDIIEEFGEEKSEKLLSIFALKRIRNRITHTYPKTSEFELIEIPGIFIILTEPVFESKLTNWEAFLCRLLHLQKITMKRCFRVMSLIFSEPIRSL